MTAQEYIQSGAIETYILGLADDAEARELELMRSLHPEVNEAFLRFETELEEQCLRAAVAPPQDMKEKIFAAAGINTSSAAPETKVVPMQPRRRPVWMQYAAAAGLAILLGSIITNIMLIGRIKNMNAQVKDMNTQIADLKNKPAATDYPFMKDPTITPVAMYGTGVHEVCRCSLYWDKKANKAYMVIHHLSQQPTDKDYQLWAIVEGQAPKSMGVLRQGPGNAQYLTMDNVPEKSSVFAVTLEKKGGSPTPTLEQMYVKGQITL